MLLPLIKVEILFAIVARICPSSKIYLILEARSTNKTAGKADTTPFIKLFNIDLKKADYKKLSEKVYFTNSIVVALILLTTEVTNLLLLKALIAIAGIFVYTYLGYKILGYIYKKKGMTKNV